MNLPIISEEQQHVINSLNNNQNVIVESVAGSGKTTCNIYIAKSFPTKSILLLTYNAKLKIETRDRINKLGITNLETHSYHSFCVKYYNHKCFTDYQIINIIKSNTMQLKKFKYDMIILDESQDITPIYHELICKIIVDNNTNYLNNLNNLQICLLGDRNQSIYDFNRADARFIIYADKLFKFNENPWIRCILSQSYRISNETAEFINNCMGKKFGIKSSKISGIKPKYIITNSYSDSMFSKQFLVLKSFLKIYKPEEIFILAPSVKNDKSPVRQLENLIKKTLKNIPVYVPTSDEEKLDEDILKNKMVFSTFHQAKGLERKVVIVYNFDDSYFKFYKKDKDTKVCPNELYVAVTRALEHLVLIHDNKNDYLPFINKTNLYKYTDFIKDGELQLLPTKKPKTFEVSVTDLIKHVPVDVLNNCMEFLTITKINDKAEIINIPFKTEQSAGFESLGKITGTAIPSYLQLKTSGRMSIYEESLLYSRENDIDDNYINSPDFVDSDSNSEDPETSKNNKLSNYDLEKINILSVKPDELLYIANYYCAKKSGFLYKIYQVDNYNWLSQDNLDNAYDRLIKLGISKKAKYEQYFELSKLPELLDRRLIGYVDCIDQNNIYEFKCVNKLENEHYLQLAIYMYLYENNIMKKTNAIIDTQIISKYKNAGNAGNTGNAGNAGLINDILIYIDINNKKLLKANSHEKIQLEDLNNRLNTQVTKLLSNNTNTKIKVYPDKQVKYNYYLYNILTNEMNQITCTFDNLKEMIKYLMASKYLGTKEIPDDIFIKNIMIVLNKYNDKVKDDILADNSNITINTTIQEIIKQEIIKQEIIDNNKFLISGEKVYSKKKDGTKGRLYGKIINGNIVEKAYA